MGFNKFVKWEWTDPHPKAFCQFCGKRLTIHRHDCYSYSALECDCAEYEKAHEQQLAEEQQKKIAEEAEKAAALAKEIAGKKQQPRQKVTITAAEMVQIVSGYMISNHHPIDVEDKVYGAFRGTQWEVGGAKKCLMAFAASHKFTEELQAAADLYAAYVKKELPDHRIVDTEAKATEFAIESGIPDTIVV